jgi:hypothetical protein
VSRPGGSQSVGALIAHWKERFCRNQTQRSMRAERAPSCRASIIRWQIVWAFDTRCMKYRVRRSPTTIDPTMLYLAFCLQPA